MTRRCMRNVAATIIGFTAGALLALGLNAWGQQVFQLRDTNQQVLDKIVVSPAFEELVRDEAQILWYPMALIDKPEGCTMSGDIILLGYPAPCGLYQFNILLYVTDDKCDILALAKSTYDESVPTIIYWYGGKEEGFICDEDSFNAGLEEYFPVGTNI